MRDCSPFSAQVTQPPYALQLFSIQTLSWPYRHPFIQYLLNANCDAGRDWEQEEKGMTEDEMAGWHHRLDGHEFE